MSTVKEVIDAYRNLSLTDCLAFYSTLTGQLTASSEERQELMMQTRHSDGIQCAFCQADHIVKNGKRRDGIQRYLCRECGRSFLATTDSVISGTRKKMAVWKEYLHCMTEKKTLKESKAEIILFAAALAEPYRLRCREIPQRPAVPFAEMGAAA